MRVETTAQRLEREAAEDRVRQNEMEKQRKAEKQKNKTRFSRVRKSEAGLSRSSRVDQSSNIVEPDFFDERCTLWVGNIPSELLDGSREMKQRRGVEQPDVTFDRSSLPTETSSDNVEQFSVLCEMFRRYGVITNISPRIKQGTNNSWAFITFTEVKAVEKVLSSALESPHLMRVPPKHSKQSARESGVLLKVKRADPEGELAKQSARQEEGALGAAWQISRQSIINNFGFNPANEQQIQAGLSQLLRVAVDYTTMKKSPIVPAFSFRLPCDCDMAR